MKVLVICTGNTCRSPMAEGIFQDMAARRVLDIEVASAGIAAHEGGPAANNSIEVMGEINIDISSHRASQLTGDMLEEYNLILTMSSNHRDTILFNFPQAREKVFNLLEYAYGRDGNILDPFGGDLQLYRKTRDEIYRAVRAIVEEWDKI